MEETPRDEERENAEELTRLPTGEDLNRLQVTTLQHYLHESNPANGPIRDHS
jgi:hypothetical protein